MIMITMVVETMVVTAATAPVMVVVAAVPRVVAALLVAAVLPVAEALREAHKQVALYESDERLT
jgi:hypothetical protein